MTTAPRSTRLVLRPLALAAASLFAASTRQAAGPVLPSGLQVVQGQATQHTSGQRLTVTNSAGALLNWQQFSIGAGQAVHFAQPDAASKVLNRVVGNDPSQIFGSLSSNGQVWLLNPHGVLFGAGARVDVAGLVASTLRLGDGAWATGQHSGNFSLTGAADGAFGSVVNQGELHSTTGGRVLLLGSSVVNQGLISAPDGQVVLAAGSMVELVDTATPRLGLRLVAPQGEVLNLGSIIAGSGRIDLQAALVNQQGIVRADSLQAGPGGQVLISASQGVGLGAASLTSASGTSGGQVQVDAGAGSLLAAGRMAATGSAGTGGSVALLGRQVGVLDGAVADASGSTGGGALRVGGGLGGNEAAWRNADATFVAAGAQLRADATVQGDGGLVVVWGSQVLRAYGSFSALGGAAGGNGGFIETSGGWIDVQPTAVRTGAVAGRAGHWLIDPFDLTISSDASDSGVSAGPNFSTTGSNATLTTGTIAAALSANNNVSITTTAGGTGNGRGDIVLRDAFLNVAPTQPVSLAFSAIGSVLMDSSSITSLNAPISVRMVAGSQGGLVGSDGASAGGVIRINASSIATAGGDITLGGPSQACGPAQGCAGNFNGAVASPGTSWFDGVWISGSSLRAGSGNIQIDGHSLVGFTDSAGVRIRSGSQLEGQRITINGSVDVDANTADGQVAYRGVQVADSGIAADGQLSIGGGVYFSNTFGGTVTATGVDISRALLRAGRAVTSDPVQPPSGSLTIDGNVVEAVRPTVGLQRIGVRIADNGTALVALGGASVAISGNSSGLTTDNGIDMSPGNVQIDASAGSSLSLSTGQSMAIGGRITAPTGGSLSLLADRDLFIDDALIDGSPATVQLRGQIVGIGLSGVSTALRFDSDALVSVQADSFWLGSLDGPSNSNANLPAGSLPTQRALGIKRPLAELPPVQAQAALVTGGSLEITANDVELGSGALLYAGATGTALRISGTDGAPVSYFFNMGDGSVVQAPNGRWQIEAADSASGDGGFEPGGLRADFWQYAARPGSAPAAAGNGFLFASTPVLGLLGDPEVLRAKAYDGTDSVDLDTLGYSLQGLRNGESLAAGLRLADRNAGTGKAVVPGTGAAGNTVVAADGTPIFGYATDPQSLQVTVSPLTLSLAAVVVANKVYDGSTTASVGSWTLGGVLAGDQVQVGHGSAAFNDVNVGQAKPVLASVTSLAGADAGNYSFSPNSLSRSTTADITPATLRYVADAKTVLAGEVLPTLSGGVQGLVGADTLASATVGALRFQTDATTNGEPGRYAINGDGLSAQNYVFTQAASNAVALTLNLPLGVLQPPSAETVASTLVTQTALLAVLPAAQATSASSGRALDAMPWLKADGKAGISFGSLDLDQLPAATVASVLAARDAYKKTVFRDALAELEANPAAADAVGCTTAQQAASGQCLVIKPLGGIGLDISNARVVDRAGVAVPGAAPGVTTAAPSVAAAVANAPAAVAAAPVLATPAPAVATAPAPRLPPLPADLEVNLPSRRSVTRAAVPQIQRKIAVVIGIDRYQDERIPKLGNAVADARAIGDTLTRSLGYETVVLENAGRATIFRTLNQLAAQVGPSDSVVLYYAGHGERVEKTGLGYWQPADADASRPETWISNADIDRLLRQLPAQQLALVSDSCYSGSLVSGERIRGGAAPQDPTSLLGRRAVVVMSSGGNEPVFDAGQNGHSPFAWSLMQSMQQVGGWKPGSNVFEQVRFAVARKLPQRPQYGSSRAGGHESGTDYVFEQRQLDVR